VPLTRTPKAELIAIFNVLLERWSAVHAIRSLHGRIGSINNSARTRILESENVCQVTLEPVRPDV